MNVIERLEFELAYYDSAVQRFKPLTPRGPPRILLERFRLFFKFDSPGVEITSNLVLYSYIIKKTINQFEGASGSIMVNKLD